MPDRLEYQSEAGNSLKRMFDEYEKLTPKNVLEDLKRQSGELAYNLYLATPRADATEIQHKVEELGPAFIRAPDEYAQKVGPKAKAFFNLNASKREKQIRKNRTKAKRINKKRAKVARQSPNLPTLREEKADGLRKGLTLTEEKFAAIKLRTGRRGSAKASWLPSARKLGSKGKAAKGDEARSQEVPRSKVEITNKPDVLDVAIVNTQSGMGKLNQKSGYVDKAFRKTEDNIRVYTTRKKTEIATRFKKASSETKR